MITLPTRPSIHRIRRETVRVYKHLADFSITAKVSGNAERDAAIGAAQSRNPATLLERMLELTLQAVKRIIGRYFRNYGHSSVGEMGNLYLSFEGISMIGALRTINFPLFRGQEASTRYLDFSEPRYRLPQSLSVNQHLLTTVEHAVHEWFGLYRDVLDICRNAFRKDGMPESEIEPRAFDIAGAFLPVAAKTSVVMTCDIRNAIEQAWRLQSHLDEEETRCIGEHMLAIIDNLCPNSVKERTEQDLADLHYVRTMLWVLSREDSDVSAARQHNLCFAASTADAEDNDGQLSDNEGGVAARMDYGNFNSQALFKDVIMNPGRDVVLRRPDSILGRYGSITGTGELSFRSMRDMWRHRPYAKEFHLLPYTFADWYIRQLPIEHRSRIEERIDAIYSTLKPVGIQLRKDLLYAMPMGIMSRFEMTGPLDKWLYLLRLRSGVKVHPEVRGIVHSWIRDLAEHLSCSEDLFGDMTPSADYRKRSGDK